ncbi:MAG: hypothetical protein RIC16_05580 [Rhodospirillales bacterium]
MIRRLLTSAIAVLALGACSSFDDLRLDDLVSIGGEEDMAACEERTVRWLEGVSFADAPLIDMEIRRGEFTPVIVRMIQNRSYVLRLRNRDDEPRVFSSPEFFESVAIAAVAIDNTILETICPGPAIELLPGQTLELQLYAVIDGSYDFFDQSGLLGEFTAWHPGGRVRIEPAF